MRSRRRNEWRSYRPPDVHGRPGGACVVAPVNSVADVVEMCATISYINSNTFKYRSSTRFSSLRANAVFTTRVPGHWRTQVFVVFRTLSGPLPAGVGTDGTTQYQAPGSAYALQICTNEPEDVSTRRLLSDNTTEESLHDAVRAVCALIHESLDPNSLSFKDAVSSRLRYFKRRNTMDTVGRVAAAHAGVEASSTSGSESDSGGLVDGKPPCGPPPGFVPPLPLEPPVARPVASHAAPAAFQKPDFESAEDLFFSFATHVIDHVSGRGRPVDPLKPVSLLDKTDRTTNVPQPLVFCHPTWSTC